MMDPTSDKISVRRSFIWQKLSNELGSEDECIAFLKAVLEAIDAQIIDYRQTKDGKFHGADERGRDMIVQFNSFVNTYIGLQVKYRSGLTAEVTESEMAQLEGQLRRAATRWFTRGGEQIRLTKVYLVIFGGAKESARDYFFDASKNLGVPAELWTTDRLINLLVQQENWSRVSTHLGWQKDFDIWYELHRQNVLGQLSYEVERYSPVLRIPLSKAHIKFRPEPIPDSGFFLSAFNSRHAVVYHGYRSQLRQVADLKLRTKVPSKSTRVIKVVGKSGIGKTSFLRAGLFHELVLATNKVEYLPLVIRSLPSWNSSSQVKSAIKDASDELGFEGDLTELRDHGVTPVIVLDQFENLLTGAKPLAGFLAAVEAARHFNGPLVLGIRNDYLYEANELVEQSEREVRISVDHEDICLNGLARIDVDQFLLKMKSPTLLSIKDKILLYLWPKGREGPQLDPARLQILIHFLLFLGEENHELALADEKVLANFEDLYLHVILSRYAELKPLLLSILMRFGLEQNSGGRIGRRTFSAQQVSTGLALEPSECDKALSVLVEARILYRHSDSVRERYELTHDRLAENLVSSYPEMYAELETVRSIEACIDMIKQREAEIPGAHILNQWLRRIESIVSPDCDELPATIIHAAQILAYAFGGAESRYPLVRLRSEDLCPPLLEGLVCACESPDSIIRITEYLSGHMSCSMLLALVDRFNLLVNRYSDRKRLEVECEFLLALADYDGELPLPLLVMMEHVDQARPDSWERVGRALGKAIASHARRSNKLLLSHEAVDATLLFNYSSCLSPTRPIIDALCTAFDQPKVRWKACRALSRHAYRLELGDHDAYTMLRQETEGALLNHLSEHGDFYRSSCDDQGRSRDLYYLLMALAFLGSASAKEKAIDIALHGVDYRLRRVAGALYIRVCTADDLRSLVDLLTQSVEPRNAKRGGDGGTPYRLRQTIFEVLQMVWDQRLRVADDKKDAYSLYLRDVVKRRLSEVTTILQDPSYLHSGEIRDPDVIDEDLTTLLVLLLSGVESWGNLDLFLSTLEQPLCFAGAYDIPEAGLVALSKLCINRVRSIAPAERRRIKTALMLCTKHPHNGVSGRAIKVFQWIGDETDLPELEALESNTIKNLRESSLLAREGIFENMGVEWGRFFDSDQFVKIWG